MLQNFFVENYGLLLFFSFIAGISAIALKASSIYLKDKPLEEYDMPHNE